LQNHRVRVGYARISTDEQSLALQRDALTAAGCAEVFEDRGVPGVAKNRPGLDAALTHIGAGDVLVVWKLDRLGRSLPHLIETVRRLGVRGAVSRRCRKTSTRQRQAAR
jgi:DNA invertase Pin-like site-specific DNA recombinase